MATARTFWIRGRSMANLSIRRLVHDVPRRPGSMRCRAARIATVTGRRGADAEAFVEQIATEALLTGRNRRADEPGRGAWPRPHEPPRGFSASAYGGDPARHLPIALGGLSGDSGSLARRQFPAHRRGPAGPFRAAPPAVPHLTRSTSGRPARRRRTTSRRGGYRAIASTPGDRHRAVSHLSSRLDRRQPGRLLVQAPRATPRLGGVRVAVASMSWLASEEPPRELREGQAR